MITHDAIFTNVARTEDNEPWWEDKKSGEPSIDWRGQPYDPDNGPAAHPNSRFTVAAGNNPVYSSLAEAPGGVPITAIVFGGRRKELAPLVYQAKSWQHGVLVGAGVASETTAANVGEVGVVRRDPMGVSYLSVLVSPDGLALYRAMISEAPHFPDLAQAFFANGPGRASRHLADFFRQQKQLGVLEIDDPQLCAEQFLSMSTT